MLNHITKKQSRILSILDNYNPTVNCCKYFLVCGIVLNGKLLCIGHNKFRSKLKNNSFGSMHAEIDALYKYSKLKVNNSKQNKIDIWIIRKEKNGFACSYPCKFCLNAIKKFHVKNIFYINHNGDLVSIKANQEVMEAYITPYQKRTFQFHNCNWNVFN